MPGGSRHLLGGVVVIFGKILRFIWAYTLPESV
jgi:hypothetical protein